MVGRETLRIDGHAHVRERPVGPSFLVAPTAFFQTNPTAAAALANIVLAYLPVEATRNLEVNRIDPRAVRLVVGRVEDALPGVAVVVFDRVRAARGRDVRVSRR